MQPHQLDGLVEPPRPDRFNEFQLASTIRRASWLAAPASREASGIGAGRTHRSGDRAGHGSIAARLRRTGRDRRTSRPGRRSPGWRIGIPAWDLDPGLICRLGPPAGFFTKAQQVGGLVRVRLPFQQGGQVASRDSVPARLHLSPDLYQSRPILATPSPTTSRHKVARKQPLMRGTQRHRHLPSFTVTLPAAARTHSSPGNAGVRRGKSSRSRRIGRIRYQSRVPRIRCRCH